LLKARGYTTAGFGKWHLGLDNGERVDYSKGKLSPNPSDHGFDTYFGIPASLDMEPYVYIENDRVMEQPTARTEGKNSPRGVFWRPGPIAPSLKIENVLPDIKKRAVEYIRARKSKPDQPFFAYVALTSPHTPWLPSAKFRGTSKAGDYGDFVAETDSVLGEIMQALDDTNQAGNTILIFTSDNGADWLPHDKQKFAHRSNAEWRGAKRDIYEGGHRVPFLVRWPGRAKSGTVTHQLGCLTDLIATAADITGARLPEGAGEDSFSFLPALINRSAKNVRQAVVHHSADGMFAIREGRWKLILGRGSGGITEPVREQGSGGQLYDLQADPGETVNLYDKQADVVARLTALMEKYRKDGRSCGRQPV
jgi:arylsulfatase A-like enzyme